jgi:hypothetical protein
MSSKIYPILSLTSSKFTGDGLFLMGLKCANSKMSEGKSILNSEYL